MSRSEEIAQELLQSMDCVHETNDAGLPATNTRKIVAALESYAKEERTEQRKAIADCLKGNAFPVTAWGKGYCAGIMAALTVFDDAARIREGKE